MADTFKVYTDAEVKDYIANLKNQGLSGEALNQRILTDANKFNISDSQLSRVTGYDVGQINNYASTKGVPILTANDAATKAANDWAATQMGRKPTTEEIAAVRDMLGSGTMSQKDIINAIDRYGVEAYNYDVQNITSAFRQAYGRNPTQAELTQAYGTYKDNQVTADKVQFNKYTPSIIQNYLQEQLQANPNDPDAAYKNVINTALQKGVTLDELADATGFQPDVIQQYADKNTLGKLDTYAAERASNPVKTFMELNTLAADPWAGRIATTNPYEVPEDATDLVTLPDGNKIQFTRNVFDALDTMGRNANLRLSDVIAATNMARANGTLGDQEAEDLIGQLTTAKSPQEGMAILSQPKAFVVVDQLYGMQIGQAKTLADAQKMAQQVSPYLTKAAQELGPEYAGVAPSQFTVGQLAEEGGVLNYPYSKSSVERIYNGYDSSRTTKDNINPNAPPGTPGSWQSQVVDPIYKRAADIIDKNYNPYSMPTQQTFPAPGGAPTNPSMRGLDFISRLGNRMSNATNYLNYTGQSAFSPANTPMATPAQQPVMGQDQTASGLGQAYQFQPPPPATLNQPLPYNAAGANQTLPMIYNIYTGTWSRAPNNLPANTNEITSAGPAGATPPVLPDNPAPVAATPVAAKAGGIIKKIKVPSGRDHFVKQYKEGKMSLKELSAKLKR